ncbi:MAG: stage sporulation protein [Thermoanaerobacteraceae bacterium]|nr:stage sporulation protein [Thermoanaerobacteraceae bacterium]MDN5301312.1 stage sporulation protein [Thermoanaerobacteraceae bacterium]MDN5313519.1 stage sporulation protein [Thermoanaerobacteraceae bacterium]
MLTDKKNSFLKGALILTLAGFVVKILGAVYRIPLALMIKDEGMGLYQMAYPIYVTLLSISTAGLPTAISKMVAEDVAVGRYKNAYRIFRVSVVVLSSVGLFLTLVLIAGAETLSVRILGNPKALYPIISIAPAIFFVSIMSSFRGFFQGLQDMTPSAVSQVVEQLGRVIAVFVLATWLLPRGVEYAAAGAAFGPVVGALAGLGILLVVYIKRKNDILINLRRDTTRILENPFHIIYRLFAFAIPITLGGLIIPIMNLADAAIVNRRLQFAGFTVKRATELYGQLTGMAAPLINLPAIVTIALSASLVPAISEAMALKNMRLAALRAETGVRISIIFGLPAAVGMFVLAEPISILLYRNPDAGIPLAVLAWGVIFLSLNQTTTGILQGVGKTLIPVRNLMIGAFAKVIINYVLTGIPFINIKGAALGSVVGYIISSLLNFGAVVRWTGLAIDLNYMIIKPVMATILMGSFVFFAHGEFMSLGFGQNMATLFAVTSGAIIYLFFLIVIGGVRRDDMEMLPGGRRIITILNKFGVFRR